MISCSTCELLILSKPKKLLHLDNQSDSSFKRQLVSRHVPAGLSYRLKVELFYKGLAGAYCTNIESMKQTATTYNY